ncbi:hypothetical protein DXG01_006784 [Tephrocybe rancida]|nr:hypothetical protein DXG01_006784 [Tephrocybe rancida]
MSDNREDPPRFRLPSTKVKPYLNKRGSNVDDLVQPWDIDDVDLYSSDSSREDEASPFYGMPAPPTPHFPSHLSFNSTRRKNAKAKVVYPKLRSTPSHSPGPNLGNLAGPQNSRVKAVYPELPSTPSRSPSPSPTRRDWQSKIDQGHRADVTNASGNGVRPLSRVLMQSRSQGQRSSVQSQFREAETPSKGVFRDPVATDSHGPLEQASQWPSSTPSRVHFSDDSEGSGDEKFARDLQEGIRRSLALSGKHNETVDAGASASTPDTPTVPARSLINNITKEPTPLKSSMRSTSRAGTPAPGAQDRASFDNDSEGSGDEKFVRDLQEGIRRSLALSGKHNETVDAGASTSTPDTPTVPARSSINNITKEPRSTSHAGTPAPGAQDRASAVPTPVPQALQEQQKSQATASPAPAVPHTPTMVSDTLDEHIPGKSV